MRSQIHLSTPFPNAYNKGRRVVCLGLVVLADILFYGNSLGLNLVFFAISVATASMLWTTKPLRAGPPIELLGLTIVASLPILEAPTAAAIALSAGAVICTSLAAAGLFPKNWTSLPSVLFRFALGVPGQFVIVFPRFFILRLDRTPALPLGKRLAVWILPITLSAAFLLLFRAANPVIEALLHDIDFSFLLQFLDPWRIAFWIAICGSVGVLMKPGLARRRGRVPSSGHTAGNLVGSLFDYGALVRSLAIFNVLFAVQTSMDIVYLWGGAELPDAMSHAEYAHRGAYPLLATALLAAAFVLIAMRRDGPGDRSPLIRNLVLVWIGQNVLLCASSILRLDLYVETYSLTWLRVAAGIWMGLVAVGLVLILLRIAFRRSNRWLIAMNLMVLTFVTYVGALVDFPAFIARFNVEHCAELSQAGVPLDIQYLSTLGPSAIPALDTYLAASSTSEFGKRQFANRIRMQLAAEFNARTDDWRSWSYRSARMAAYLNSTIPFAR